MEERPQHDNGKIGAKWRFKNPWASASEPKGFLAFLKMRLLDWKSAKNDPEELARLFVKPGGVDWEAVRNPPAQGAAQLTWLGHSSFLVQMDGLTVLTDPIFSQRCSASQYVGPKRLTPPACQAADIPVPVDVCAISHSHYDHLDELSVRALSERVALWAVPLGVKRHLVDFGVPEERVTELDWWGEVEVRGARVVCTPAQHFSGRTLMDTNSTLWSSWAVVGDTARYWFGGDTGYRSVPREVHGLAEERGAGLPVCPAFAEIGRRLGPFDVACVPIGAYSPRWFMSPIHLSPEDAVDVHVDVRARRSVGCHCCTFCLTDEPMTEPPERVGVEMRARRLPDDAFVNMQIGETRSFPSVPAGEPWPEPLPFAEAEGGWETRADANK